MVHPTEKQFMLSTSPPSAGWEETHWLQLFHMLGFKTSGPNAITKENVTLAHFLDKADALVKNAEAIKALDSQAQVRVQTGMRRQLALPVEAQGLNRNASLPTNVSRMVSLLSLTTSAYMWFWVQFKGDSKQ